MKCVCFICLADSPCSLFHSVDRCWSYGGAFGVVLRLGVGSVSRTVIVLPAKTEALQGQWQRQTQNNLHVHRLISVPDDVLLPILALPSANLSNNVPRRSELSIKTITKLESRNLFFEKIRDCNHKVVKTKLKNQSTRIKNIRQVLWSSSKSAKKTMTPSSEKYDTFKQ